MEIKLALNEYWNVKVLIYYNGFTHKDDAIETPFHQISSGYN
jgi:hypothetical protein